MFGSGSAGVGIVDLLLAAMKEQGLTEGDARQRIYAFNRRGLIVEGDPELRASQVPLARRRAEVESWRLQETARSRCWTRYATRGSRRWWGFRRRREHSPRRSCARWRGRQSDL